MERGLSVTRRRLLGFAAGAAAGAAVGVPAGRTLGDFLQATNLPVYPPRGPESFVLAVCNLCPGGCGLRVRRIGERAVKVDGNPLHPVDGGRPVPADRPPSRVCITPTGCGGLFAGSDREACCLPFRRSRGAARSTTSPRG